MSYRHAVAAADVLRGRDGAADAVGAGGAIVASAPYDRADLWLHVAQVGLAGAAVRRRRRTEQPHHQLETRLLQLQVEPVATQEVHDGRRAQGEGLWTEGRGEEGYRARVCGQRGGVRRGMG